MNFNTAAFERFAVTFQKEDIIFCEYEPGDAFYLIQEGRVRISKIMGDIEKTIDVLYPGEIFGEMAILEEAPRSASAIALDKVKALEFNRENFTILLQGNPQIAMKLLKLFTKRIYDQRRRFQILTLEDTQARIVDVFLMLSEQLPPDQAERNQQVFEVSVDDVAHWAGLSIEKTSDIINQLITQRRIEVSTGKIIVKNIHDLRRFVQSRRKDR
ncbi:Crp/Fnr family transcriptional regulator [Salinispira pacifica]|uniref:Transcriptional regulator, Crp/Fnr family n=1 Tax=Salinispira pacifica TaxID=1307761 RepID=V5WG94_9SPIO|nr:Crp/Fnr family transcriptional regulator [Salinispira pacifica]AHC14813.1 transcriptional regulator, Crp/Fnr family [Salinispira pacifica]